MTDRHVVLVTGGRHYTVEDRVWSALDAAHARKPITLLIEGGCPTGADLFARRWAAARGVPHQTYAARWHSEGKAAGPRRNARMVRDGAPDEALAFAGNDGTHDCVSRLRKARIPLVDVDGWWENVA